MTTSEKSKGTLCIFVLADTHNRWQAGDANIRQLAKQRSDHCVRSTNRREILARHVVRTRPLGESSSMRSLRLACLSMSLLLVLGGCKERVSTIAPRDACSLVSKEQVGSVQEAPVNETKSSERSDGVFRVSQCFYAAAEFSKSVSLALIQKDPNQRDKRGPKEFWKEKKELRQKRSAASETMPIGSAIDSAACFIF